LNFVLFNDKKYTTDRCVTFNPWSLKPMQAGKTHTLRKRSGPIVRAGKLMLLLPVLLLVSCGGQQPKPEIVTVYACTRYCPGPDNIYYKRVYLGVNDERQCRKLDGEPYTYGLNWVCVVK
jgi:hypothetical protein